MCPGDCSYVLFYLFPCCNANLSIPWTCITRFLIRIGSVSSGLFGSAVPRCFPWALSLGFKRPDPLYRIKSNERKITLALAVRILRNWPQFNLGWLLTGQGPVRLEVGPASGEGNLSPLSGDAVSPQRKFGAPPTAESIVGRWELTHAFSLVDEWQSDGQPDATFACNEIVWDFGPDRIVVQYEWGVEVAREGYLYDPASGQLFVEHSVMQIVRLNAETLEFLDRSDSEKGSAAVFVFRCVR